ncbi:hypothetical protein KIPB_008390 [Kipferlia bialata]|uniref:non-specific serine/threonine protein kinase n=1 Tax=Kipferlia bialata TaxID=797122 RepID=A0A9K3GJT7_9EUKA|nr:hypothetical protein KIPB_008390 [Kipferlia bialata]|eukprot:g8390.t1
MSSTLTGRPRNGSSVSALGNAQDYENLVLVGQGSFGTVYVADRISTQTQVAVKKVDMVAAAHASQSREEVNAFMDRMEVALELFKDVSADPHPNIVQYIDSFVDPKTSDLFIVMDYVKGIDMSQIIKLRREDPSTLSMRRIVNYSRQLVNALVHIHGMKPMVVHRDIKPENILVDDVGIIKMVDFGLARSIKPESLAITYCGSPLYMSPEIFRAEPYDEKTDIWSLGCMLYELVSGNHPFEAKNLADLTHQLQTASYKPLREERVGPLAPLINSMLRRNPRERPSAVDILQCPPFVELPQTPFEETRALVAQKLELETELANKSMRLGEVISRLHHIAQGGDLELKAVVGEHGAESPFFDYPRAISCQIGLVEGPIGPAPIPGLPLAQVVREERAPGGPCVEIIRIVSETIRLRLGVINLSKVVVSLEDIAYLKQSSSALGRLVTIRLGKVAPGCAAALGDWFLNLPFPDDCRKLDIADIFHTEDEVKLLAKVLHKLPAMQSLKLSDMPLATMPAATEALFLALDDKRFLKSLKLIRCQMGLSDVLMQFMSLSPNLPSLQKLVMLDNGLMDQHVQIISTLSSYHDRMTSFDLARNSFTSLGNMALKTIKCVTLTHGKSKSKLDKAAAKAAALANDQSADMTSMA